MSRDFASRAELCSALGEVEECHEGVLQRAANASSRAAAWLAAALWASLAAADDTVILTAPNNPQGRIKVTGKVVDYTGAELTLETASGAQRQYPGDAVREIESDWCDAQLAADALYAKPDFAAAAAEYELALAQEQRRWARRLIVARQVDCLRETEQWGRAADKFLALVHDDPDTPYYAAIPLAWLPAAPSADLERRASAWFASDQPEAVLIGASHRLASADRADALRRLQGLTAHRDPRVAALAAALVWNGSFATATDERIAEWEARVESFPAALRAGPYFVVGRAWTARQRREEAALALLRVPIQYPRQWQLAAAALYEAGRNLEQAQRPQQGADLYREVLSQYGGSSRAGDARARLEVLETPARTPRLPPG